MTKIIEFKNITKTYNGKNILHNFNLAIDARDFLCIVGTSGSGKTTLLKMINGLILPDAGEVLIYGELLTKNNLIPLRRKIGYAIQGNSLFPHMTVAENISYVPRLEGKSKQELASIVKEMLGLVSLPMDIINKYPHELSGGQQQRVGIARAYANKPSILLMDEPFGAVDNITRNQLQRDLRIIHKTTGCTIVFITHDIEEALKMGTHILVMAQGNIEQYGTVEEVINHPQTDFVKQLLSQRQN